MSGFAEYALTQGLTNPHAKRDEPLWAGPEAVGERGGITFSMLSKWLVDRERFRVRYIEGWKPVQTFVPKMEYGNMWHACEEALAKCSANDPSRWLMVDEALQAHGRKLLEEHQTQGAEINRWLQICLLQFRTYQHYWAQHPDVQARIPVLSEQVFDVPYTLPSGRTVRLRGKWDSVDLVGKELWLQENKTKGDIKEQLIERQLRFDLQTMMYLVALQTEQSRLDDSTIKARTSYRDGQWRHFYPIAGVRYNVIRRPLSGGKGSIVQSQGTKGTKCSKCKGTGALNPPGSHPCPKCNGVGRVDAKPAETDEEFMARLADYWKTEPESFFYRWNVPISTDQVLDFRRRCLDPILEQLCMWYEGVRDSFRGGTDPFGYVSGHYVHPFGVYSVLNEGGVTDLDSFVIEGNMGGLVASDQLFTELQEN